MIITGLVAIGVILSKCFTIGLSINQSFIMLESEKYKLIYILAEVLNT